MKWDLMQNSVQQTNMPDTAKLAFCEGAIKWFTFLLPCCSVRNENANLVR